MPYVMNTKVTLYLPTHDGKDIDEYAFKMTDMYGGCTVIKECKGYWKSGRAIIKDNITLLVSYASFGAEVARNMAYDLAQEIADVYDQECVSVEVSDTLYLVTRKDKG